MSRSANQQTLEFQLELMMVHLEQMNKRLDMLEKTCVSLIEKNNATQVVCPYHSQQMTAQQHLDKRIHHDRLQELSAADNQSQKNSATTSTRSTPKNIATMQRRTAV